MGEESSKYKNSFQLIGPDTIYILSSDDYQIWMMRILAAVTQYLESFPSPDSEISMSINNPMRYGTFEFPSSQKYTGWWNCGQFDGFGNSLFFNSIYEGSWRSHERSGQGCLTFYTGDVYNGDWMNDLQSRLNFLLWGWRILLFVDIWFFF